MPKFHKISHAIQIFFCTHTDIHTDDRPSILINPLLRMRTRGNNLRIMDKALVLQMWT